MTEAQGDQLLLLVAEIADNVEHIAFFVPLICIVLGVIFGQLTWRLFLLAVGSSRFWGLLLLCGVCSNTFADDCIEYHIAEVTWPGMTSSDVAAQVTAPVDLLGGSLRIIAVVYDGDEFGTSQQFFTTGRVLYANCVGGAGTISDVSTQLGGNISSASTITGGATASSLQTSLDAHSIAMPVAIGTVSTVTGEDLGCACSGAECAPCGADGELVVSNFGGDWNGTGGTSGVLEGWFNEAGSSYYFGITCNGDNETHAVIWKDAAETGQVMAEVMIDGDGPWTLTYLGRSVTLDCDVSSSTPDDCEICETGEVLSVVYSGLNWTNTTGVNGTFLDGAGRTVGVRIVCDPGGTRVELFDINDIATVLGETTIGGAGPWIVAHDGHSVSLSCESGTLDPPEGTYDCDADGVDDRLQSPVPTCGDCDGDGQHDADQEPTPGCAFGDCGCFDGLGESIVEAIEQQTEDLIEALTGDEPTSEELAELQNLDQPEFDGLTRASNADEVFSSLIPDWSITGATPMDLVVAFPEPIGTLTFPGVPAAGSTFDTVRIIARQGSLIGFGLLFVGGCFRVVRQW